MALLSVGVLLSASAAPINTPDFAASDSAPAVVVPEVALTQRATPQTGADALSLLPPNAAAVNGGPGAPSPLVPVVPADTDPDSSTPVTLDSSGIPARALESYRTAAQLTNEADPGCHIDWALVAAIGRVESDHARFGGNQLDSGAVAQPGIIGIALDGTNGTARITDSDGGQWDGDTTYDRAVGPMQFIPGTWRSTGVDADGDGQKNPQDMADAATATAIYLCSGPGDLSTAGDLRSSILRYNYSDSYVQMVTSIAAAYRQGVSALPASDLAPTAPSRPTAKQSVDRIIATAAATASPGASQAATLPPAPSTTIRPPSTPTTRTTAPPIRPVPSSTTSTTAPTTTPTAPTKTTTTAPPTTSTTTTPPPTTTTTTTTPAPTTTTTPAPTTTTTTTPPATTTTTAAPDPTVTCEPTTTDTATATATETSTPPPATPAPCLPPDPCLPTTPADVPCVTPPTP